MVRFMVLQESSAFLSIIILPLTPVPALQNAGVSFQEIYDDSSIHSLDITESVQYRMASHLRKNTQSISHLLHLAYYLFSIPSHVETDALGSSRYTRQQSLNKICQTSGAKIQIPLPGKLSPNIEEAPEDKMKGKQGAGNLCLFTLQLWNFLSCTL